jgi:hypothetical protein
MNTFPPLNKLLPFENVKDIKECLKMYDEIPMDQLYPIFLNHCKKNNRYVQKVVEHTMTFEPELYYQIEKDIFGRGYPSSLLIGNRIINDFIFECTKKTVNDYLQYALVDSILKYPSSAKNFYNMNISLFSPKKNDPKGQYFIDHTETFNHYFKDHPEKLKTVSNRNKQDIIELIYACFDAKFSNYFYQTNNNMLMVIFFMLCSHKHIISSNEPYTFTISDEELKTMLTDPEVIKDCSILFYGLLQMYQFTYYGLYDIWNVSAEMKKINIQTFETNFDYQMMPNIKTNMYNLPPIQILLNYYNEVANVLPIKPLIKNYGSNSFSFFISVTVTEYALSNVDNINAAVKSYLYFCLPEVSTIEAKYGILVKQLRKIPYYYFVPITCIALLYVYIYKTWKELRPLNMDFREPFKEFYFSYLKNPYNVLILYIISYSLVSLIEKKHKQKNRNRNIESNPIVSTSVQISTEETPAQIVNKTNTNNTEIISTSQTSPKNKLNSTNSNKKSKKIQFNPEITLRNTLVTYTGPNKNNKVITQHINNKTVYEQEKPHKAHSRRIIKNSKGILEYVNPQIKQNYNKNMWNVKKESKNNSSTPSNSIMEYTNYNIPIKNNDKIYYNQYKNKPFKEIKESKYFKQKINELKMNQNSPLKNRTDDEILRYILDKMKSTYNKK